MFELGRKPDVIIRQCLPLVRVQFLRIQWILWRWKWRCRYSKGPPRVTLLMNVIRQGGFASATKMSVWINNREGRCIGPALDQTMIIYQLIKVNPVICKYIGYGGNIYFRCCFGTEKKKCSILTKLFIHRLHHIAVLIDWHTRWNKSSEFVSVFM
jgi:hypothetical protein